MSESPQYFFRRDQDIERAIRKTWGPPRWVDDFISPSERRELADIFKSGIDKDHNNQEWCGSSRIFGAKLHEEFALIRNIVEDRLLPLFSESIEVRLCWLHHLSKPIRVHTDTGSVQCQKPFKIVEIIVEASPLGGSSYVVLFDQIHTGFSTAFLHGAENIWGYEGPLKNTYENGVPTGPFEQGQVLLCFDPYTFLENYNGGRPIDESIYQKYLGHVPRSNFDGLTFRCAIESAPGRMVYWNAGHLHCSSIFPEGYSKLIMTVYLDLK